VSRGDTIVWLFDPRFDGLCDRFVEHLVGRHAVLRPEVVMGHELVPGVTVSGGTRELRQPSPEEVNRRFLQAWDEGISSVPRGANGLVVGFTMDGIEQREGLALFGASSLTAHHLNDKTRQFRWLEDAGVPLPPFDIAAGIDDLKRRINPLLDRHGEVVIQPAHSAGGDFAALIRTPGEFGDYARRLVAVAGDALKEPFLITRFLSGAVSVSGHGLVTRSGSVLVLGVNELLLDGFRFDGFIFPSFLEIAAERCVQAITRRVGEVLAAKEYWGYFAADFLIAPGGVVVVNEINVRFAGETAFLTPFLRRNLFDLLADSAAPGPEPLFIPPAKRMVVTKIRPTIGRTVIAHDPVADFNAFAAGAVSRFRVFHFDAPLRIVSGHFIGTAGAWFPMDAKREILFEFYVDQRRPVDSTLE